MAVDQARIEIDRINNLIRNFGWDVSKQEILKDKIILTIQKPVSIPALAGVPGAD